MATDSPPSAASLGTLLRTLRERALLTQEQLAERAGLSVRTVHGVESGQIRRPRSASLRLLADALALAGQDRDLLIAAAGRPSPGPAARRPARDAVSPAQLPPDIAAFTGRSAEVGRLDQLLAVRDDSTAAAAVALISGAAGIGKTALALHWAHRVRDRFPDGQLFVNLRGFAAAAPRAPIEALAGLLRALGRPGEEIPVGVDEAAAMYRSLLSGKRILVILDNASSVEQVRPLLPGGAGCVAIITSRDQLAGLVARDGARWFGLGVLAAAEGYTLLEHMLGADRVAAEPEAAGQLARRCGYLPLALRVAAANLTTRPHLPIAEYLAQLGHRLEALTVRGDPQGSVSAAFDLSYARLPGPARRLFRLLGLAPGADVTAPAAAALAQVSTEQASELLTGLAQAHLCEEHAPGRYACHDLLRSYAAGRAEHEETGPDREAARQRLLGWYRDTAQAAASMLYPGTLRLPSVTTPGAVPPPVAFDDPARAAAWFDTERANLLAAITDASEHGPRPVAWQLAHCLRGYWWHGSHLVDWQTAATAAAVAASREADQHGQVVTELSFGSLRSRLGRHREASEHFVRALEVARQAGWVEGQSSALGNGGANDLYVGRLDRAVTQLTEALVLSRKLGQLGTQAVTLHNLGLAHSQLGQLRQAYQCYAESLALSREAGAPSGMDTTTLSNLGSMARDLGRLEEAREHVTQALSTNRERGHRYGEAHILDSLALVHRDAGRLDEALEAAEAALRLAREIGDRRVEAAAHNTVGSVHQHANRPQPASESHRRALDLARQAPEQGYQIDALLGLAAAARDLGHHADARNHATQALERAQHHGYRLRQGQALTALAAIHFGQHQLADARQHAELALACHRETGYRLGEARTHLILGHLNQQTGQAGAARHHWRRAGELFADMGTLGR